MPTISKRSLGKTIKIGRLSKKKYRVNIVTARDQLHKYLERFEIKEKADGKPIYKLTKPNIKLLCLYILAVLNLDKNDIDKIINLIDVDNYDEEKLRAFLEYLFNLLDGEKINIRYHDEEPLNIHQFINTKSFAIKELCFLHSNNNTEKAYKIQTNLNLLISNLFTNDNNSRVNEIFKKREYDMSGYDTYVFLNAFQDVDEINKTANSNSNYNDLYTPSTNSNLNRKYSNIRYTEQGNKVNIADISVYTAIKLGEIVLSTDNNPIQKYGRKSSNRRWSASAYSRNTRNYYSRKRTSY
jgi:hypothetical protein